MSIVTGMSFWVKADAGVLNASGVACAVGDTVQTWQDQSGNNNHLTAPTSGQRPIYGGGSLPGGNVIRFDGTAQQTLRNAITYSSPFTAFIIARIYDTGSGSGGIQRVFGAGNNWLMGWWTGRADQFYWEGTNNLGGSFSTDTTVHQYTGRADGSVYAFRGNGAVIASGSGNPPGPDNVSINGSPAYPEYSNCDVAEAIIYPTALSDPQVVQNEAYLARWTTQSSLLIRRRRAA